MYTLSHSGRGIYSYLPCPPPAQPCTTRHFSNVRGVSDTNSFLPLSTPTRPYPPKPTPTPACRCPALPSHAQPGILSFAEEQKNRRRFEAVRATSRLCWLSRPAIQSDISASHLKTATALCVGRVPFMRKVQPDRPFRTQKHPGRGIGLHFL